MAHLAQKYLHRLDHLKQPLRLSSLLMLGGFLRNDFPWLAELILESYREIRDGGPKEAEIVSRRLNREIKNMMHGPMREMSRGSKEAFMLAEELPMLLDMVIHPMIERSESVDSPDK